MRYFDLPPVIEQMLKVSDKISDLNFSVNQPPQVEINGRLTHVEVPGLQKLTPYQTEIIAMTLMQGNPDAAHRLAHTGSSDLSYSLPSRTRFRVNIFQQRGTYSIVMRVIPTAVPTLEGMHLPAQLGEVAELRNGIVLVTGPTGSGKSTTLAAIINLINERQYHHVVTIEDPIEFLHTHKNSTINQREIGSDAKDFPSALRAALRQAPKVILVGEMRDRETIEVALEAAETGHLVLSTLHTLDATETVRRIVSSFPPHLQKSVRIQLAGILRAVISMRLVRSAEGAGRVPAAEVMVSTGLIRDYIINEEKTSLIRDAIAAGTSQYGMQTFDQSLFSLHQSGLITMEEALRGASNPDEFRLRVAGIRSASDQAKEDMERLTTVTTGPSPREK